MIADHIKRQLGDADGLDFEGLRSSGIDVLQALSSANWTDYNAHDPGVTLLEMLCYGLTDLVYRTDFDVADYLTGPTGQIDFEQQALFPPERIFPGAPVTEVDFCKLIYDQLPQVDDVWISANHVDGCPDGLFSVFIKPRESLFHARETGDEDLRMQVLALLARHRNLGRDVERVCIVASEPYTLAGDIDIDDSRPAAEIYADLYVQCANLISSGGRIIRFEDARAAGMQWEDLLDGPLTRHGIIEDGHFSTPNFDIDSMRLIALARQVSGVRQVRKLCLVSSDNREIDAIRLAPSSQVCPVLAFPDDPVKAQKLRLFHGSAPGQLAAGANALAQAGDGGTRNRDARQFHEAVRLSIKRLEFNNDAFRSGDGQLERLVELPHGQYRPLDTYSSVAEHTPAIYGVNHYGVPSSMPPEAHARALQLKAYLYPFEQMMANYAASLHGIKRLYSTDSTLDRTCFARFLDKGAVPNIDLLYRAGVGKAEIDAVLREQDQFADRRNRVLDTLLAMYGEVFPDDALRRYDLYHADDDRAALDLHLIDCKIALLRQLCELSSNRGKGVDVLAGQGDGAGVAPVQRRVQCLAGMQQAVGARSLSAGLLHDGIALVSDRRYQAGLAADAPAEVKFDDTGPLAVPAAQDAQDAQDGQNGAAALPLSPLLLPPRGAVSPALLLAGIRRESYRVLPADGDTGWLCLNVTDSACWPLTRLPLAQLPVAARRLRQLLIELNRAAEGFHLLEHVLLRARDGGAASAPTADFYAHRVSVILPAFTARFADPNCRAWVEELIAQHLPAHILPQFYWLDFPLLAQFEQRQATWLALLRAHSLGQPAAGLDAAAGSLIDFLDKNARYHTNRIWS